MLRKVDGIGAVLEHVCQLLVPKVVDLEVIWEVSEGGRPGGLLEVNLGLSWGLMWRSL